jgi:hypothetical protein
MKTVLESKGRIFAPRSSFNLRTALPFNRHCLASFFVEQGSAIVVLGSDTFGISSQMVKTLKKTKILFLKIMQTKKKLVKVRQSQNNFFKLLFPPKNKQRNFSQTFLQLLYGNRVFGNVYLSA